MPSDLMPKSWGLIPLLEVLRRDAVHPVLELVHDLVLGGLLHCLLELDAGLLDHLVGGEDFGAGADRKRYGIRGARVHLDGSAVEVEADGGEESLVSERGDRDALHRGAELVDEVQGKVVGKGADELLVLELHQDRTCLRLADPDGKVAVLVLDLEDDDRAGGKEVHVHAVDGHLGEAVGAHWLYAPLTPRIARGECSEFGRFYFPPPVPAIGLSGTRACCTLSRRRASVASITPGL